MFNKFLSIGLVSIIFALPVAADSRPELAIINTGSKGGGFFMESNGFALDLANKFNVEYINPGNACVAASAISKLEKKKPVLFPWDSSYEAAGREQNTCPMTFTQAELIRVHYDAFTVCSKNPAMTAQEFIKRGNSMKIGIVNPSNVFVNTVSAVNTSFGTMHKAVHYSTSSGALVAALENGEVDYGIIESKVARQIMKSGHTCHWSLSKSDGTGLPGLAARDPANKKLQAGYFVTFILKNATPEIRQQVRTTMEQAHTVPGTNTYRIWNESGMKFTWDPTLSTFGPAWEDSVKMYLDK
jgi:hypothetical protein